MAHEPGPRTSEPATAATDTPVTAGHEPVRPGWQPAEHTALPAPTYAPAVMAFGITLLTWGLLTTVLISVVGLVLFGLALAMWIGELRHGH